MTSPLPWTSHPYKGHWSNNLAYITDANGEHVCKGLKPEDAELICGAVNNAKRMRAAELELEASKGLDLLRQGHDLNAEGWSYSAFRDGVDSWTIEVNPPNEPSYRLPFSSEEAMSDALFILTGQTFREFVESCS